MLFKHNSNPTGNICRTWQTALLLAGCLCCNPAAEAKTADRQASFSAGTNEPTQMTIRPYADGQEPFEGWGISLCWWANMCGSWSEERIDSLVDWLVSPQGLNFRIFRYNIGGGDDPMNRNCTPHHMGKG